MSESQGEITRLVGQWSSGEEEAFDALMSLVYDDLLRMAHRHLDHRERDGILDTTVLVHEAYLRLAGVEEWDARGDADRLEAAGFGESRPVADNAAPEGKQQNRRVELVRLDG